MSEAEVCTAQELVERLKVNAATPPVKNPSNEKESRDWDMVSGRQTRIQNWTRSRVPETRTAGLCS
jgi:hypothetical protein